MKMKTKINCKYCGCEFIGDTKRKFCSSVCSAKFNNKGICRNKKKKLDNCINCGGKLNKSSQKKFCSLSCSNEYKWLYKMIPLIESGKCTQQLTVKKYLFMTRGEKCELCGQLPTWNGKPLTLQIDHIDGNSDNNELNNVRILCPHCHSQTDTFVSRNIKNTNRNSYLRRYKKKVLYMENII